MAREDDERAIILRHGVSFASWRASLNGALARGSLLGYVHKNMPGIIPRNKPVLLNNAGEAESAALEKWIEGNYKAVDVIIRRLDKSLQPFETDDGLVASELFKSISEANKPSIMNPFHEAWYKLWFTKFRTTADQYCLDFQRNLQGARSAGASALADFPDGDYSLGPSIISWMFFLGTMHIPWLDTWRAVGAIGGNRLQFAPLDVMMATLRSTAGQRRLTSAAGANSRNVGASAVSADPEAQCTDCSHQHTNKKCFKKHPELRPGNNNTSNEKDRKKSKDKDREKDRSKGKGKGKGKSAAATPKEASESESEASVESINRLSAALPLVSSAKQDSDDCLTSDSIIYDSGASRHFIRSKSAFQKLQRLQNPFRFNQAINEGCLKYGGTAKIRFGDLRLKLEDSLYSPHSTCSLLSAIRMERIGGMHQEGLYLISTAEAKPVARLVRINDVLVIKPLTEDCKSRYQVPSIPLTIAAPAVARIPKISDAQRWHQRLGHAGAKILAKTKALSKGLEGIDTSELALCRACHLSKAQRVVSRNSRPLPSSPLDEVFIDVVGPIDASLEGNRYITVVTDAHSRLRWALASVGKATISTDIKQFIRQQEHQYGKLVRLIFSDGGSEIQNSVIKDLALIEGIRLDKSAPYTPEQNGLSESSNKVILTRARSMLIDAGLPPFYWEHAVQHACFITNRLYNLKTKTAPLLSFLQGLKQPHHTQIDMSGIPRFGCKAFKYVDNHTGKFTARAIEGWFMGFQANTSKNYNILALHEQPGGGKGWRFFTTPHASFDEDSLMGPLLYGPQQLQISEQWEHTNFEQHGEFHPKSTHAQITPLEQGEQEQLTPTPDLGELHPNEVQHPLNAQESLHPNEVQHSLDIQHSNMLQHPNEVPDLGEHIEIPTQNPQPDVPIEGTQEDIKDPIEGNTTFTGLNDLATEQVDIDDGDVEEIERSHEDEVIDIPMLPFNPPTHTGKRQRSPSPSQEVMISSRGRAVKQQDYKRLHTGKAVIQSITPVTPKTYAEALTTPEAKHWRAAAAAELESLKSTGAIKQIRRQDVPKNRTLMTGKWVFKKKLHADGSLDKYKARWTARGFTQREGLDFFETYAPTPRSETFRLLLAMMLHLGWYRKQIDVAGAFLNPDLDVTIYIQMPEGFSDSTKAMQVSKGLYGLKQSAALWYDHAKITLARQGLFPSNSDACLYINEAHDLFVLVHVDDFQILGPNKAKIDKLLQALGKKYKLNTVSGNLFLGIEIDTSNPQKLKLSQGQYARSLLERHGLKDCKSVSSPLQSLLMPSEEEKPDKQVKHEYNSIIGGLQYLSINTRPDITHSVNHLARFLVNPSLQHLTAAKRILRYISKNPDSGISMTKSESPILEAYTDADFSGDPSTARSTTGSLVRLGGPILWNSTLQRSVVLSTTEAEYVALTETCRQLACIRNLLKELHVRKRVTNGRQPKVYVDNQSAIHLVKNHTNHKRSRHVSLRNHYCREQYDSKRIDVIYIRTADQLADALTKASSPVLIR